MVFNVPQVWDEFITIQFLLLFVLGFCVNVYGSGSANLVLIKDVYDVSPYQDFDFPTDRQIYVRSFAENIYSQSRIAFWISMLIYWVLIPSICFYYGIFKFRKVFKD